MSFFFSKILNLTFEEAYQRLVETLKENGFGVVSEIYVSELLKEKIGANLPNYKIVGACNPNFAFKALSIENKVGLFLPCNFVMRKIDDLQVEIAVIDPTFAMKLLENPPLLDLVGEVREHVKKVIDCL
ncbi:MAG: DUF302 domain-containing protein [Ignavibacteria bacterium]|nr:DUF302 domain-containing protein [Ignavibacteria bacterium]